MIAYKKEGINLTTRYTLEYVDNKKDFEYIESGNTSNGEPWEHYKKRTYDNIDDAMSIFMIYLVRSDILDVKLFEEIILNDETIQERYIEPTSTTAYCIKTAVEKSLYENNRTLINENETLKEENEIYKSYLNKFHLSMSDIIKQLETNKTA